MGMRTTTLDRDSTPMILMIAARDVPTSLIFQKVFLLKVSKLDKVLKK